MIRTAVALPYELARMPLALLDKRLSQLLPETSGPRVALDKAMGSADKLAGTVLANPGIARRGSERLERSAKLLTAARLELDAAARRERADETVAAGRRQASDQRDAAQDRIASGLDEADAVEAQAKQEAATAAAQAAAAKKADADQRASSRAAGVEQRKKQVDSVAAAKKKAARQAASSELDDARTTEQTAAEAKADADRLKDLAETKKQQRTQR
ncbi:hypothetical protein [Nocardioides sp.]|uniref:hypothetical protein n=1 Tax=Nocardioides sp. TaxID=35761 RepID=UPI00271E4848|nr:hypothetical protein [Nocardioides sp.]MDO9454538.1 hypothetical protein [Nocardioides sp.]